MTRRGTAIIVAYYVPPAVGIAVHRISAFLRYLPEFGWDPVLIAPASVHYHVSDSEEAERRLEGVRVVRVPNPEISRFLRKLAGHGGEIPPEPGGSVRELLPVQTASPGSLVRGLVRDWLYIPDAQVLWIPGAGRAASAAAAAALGGPRVLFSSSVPFTCHLAAYRAATQTGVPWVAEYRDPWSTAPPQMRRRSFIRQHIDSRMDHMVTRRANHVTVTSERTRDLFLESFFDLGPTDISVVRNGWEEGEHHGEKPPAPPAPLSLVYAGSLRQPEWARPLLDGIERVLAREPGAVTLDVYGPKEVWEVAAAGDSDRMPFLRLHGLVRGREVPAVLRAASAVVILDPKQADLGLTVPGKVYDGIGARRPVLSDILPDSESGRLLSDHGDLRSFAGAGARGVAEEVGRLLAQHRSGTLQAPSVPSEDVAELSRRAQTARLAATFDRMTRR